MIEVVEVVVVVSELTRLGDAGGDVAGDGDDVDMLLVMEMMVVSELTRSS